MKPFELVSLALAVVFSVPTVMIDYAGAGEKLKGSYTKTSTREISRNDIIPSDNPKHKMSQWVSIDTVKFSVPELGSSEDWGYGQADSYAGTGTHRGYTTSSYENGDQTFQKWEGTHKTTIKEDGSWENTYEGTYQHIGGTGKFQNIKGNGVYRGKVTPKGRTEEGEYTVEY